MAFFHKSYNYFKKHSSFLGALASFIVVLTALIGILTFLAEKNEQRSSKKDELYAGIWTNPSEGCLGCGLENDQERPITLYLNVNNGSISGNMDASAWLNNYRESKQSNEPSKIEKDNDEVFLSEAGKIALSLLHKNLIVEGKLNLMGGKLYIFDYNMGKRVPYGVGKITMEEELMELEMIGDHFLGIPDHANLYKTYDKQGNACKNAQDDAPWICLD